MSEIRGVPVVFKHHVLPQVHFATGNVVTFIESVAIHFDELIRIADALIAQIQEASSQRL